MNFTDPISTLMSKRLMTVSPSDRMNSVKEIFDQHKVHHILVELHGKLVGIISKTDYLQFLRCTPNSDTEKLVVSSRLYSFSAGEIMTKDLVTLESTDRIITALRLFEENNFHAIPIVDNEEIVGIFTTYDIIKSLLAEDLARTTAKISS